MVQKGPVTVMQKTQAPGQSSMNYEKISQDPLKHVVTFIEKKIRNLDKRKAKLDGYRRMVEDGKPLDPDQTAAASKYDEVIGSLEFAKDLIKSFEATTTEVMKQQRKLSRRERMAREEAENNHVCFVVKASRIMELLHENEAFREDFLNGSNGACVVSKTDLDQLVNFYEQFIMKSCAVGTNIIEDANSAGNHLYELAEGRSKDIARTTCKDLHNLLGRIIDCKYFEDLRDPNQAINVVHAPTEENEAANSVSSESIVEDDAVEAPSSLGQAEEEVQDNNTGASGVLSPNATDPISSSSGFSADAPLLTEEFLPSANLVKHNTHPPWYQQQAPSSLLQKPEAGDYLAQDVSFQYAPNNPHQMMQRAYEAQRIQEVLAEVQGPCQFLQDSIIDQEIGSSPVIPYSRMDMHQQSLPAMVPPHLVAPTHLRASALESAFQNTQNMSPVDPAMIVSQGLPNVQQHLITSANDSPPSHIPTTVNPQERLSVEQPPETLQDSRDQDNFRGQLSYMPATTTTPPNMDYSLGHQPLQQADNLGLGQTTFGGQQQTPDSHLTYSEPSGFQKDKVQTGYTSETTNAPQPGGIQNSIQHQLSSQSVQSSDSPIPHIPLPNDQQSGYRGFQTNEAQHQENENVHARDASSQEKHSMGINKDQTPSDVGSKETQDSAPDVTGSSQQPDSRLVRPSDQSSNYNSGSGSPNQQQPGGPQPRRGREGYSNSGGYRSGPANQGGNYQPQRYNNSYRPSGGRYTNNYDNTGRPGNYSGGGGGYQGNQSGNGYRPNQDQYSGYRRGGGGGMRGGRGGQSRGNPRSGGGYNRSRTFRPQHSNEQAV